MESPTTNITVLLHQAGDPQNGEAWQQLYQAVEGELRLIAESLLKRYGPGNHALQATVLIDEALIRLVAQQHEPLEDRTKFYRFASGVMRHMLIDHARRHRPGNLDGEQLASIADAKASAPHERLARSERLLALDGALDRLHEQDWKAAELFELHYFGSLRLSLGATPDEWIIQLPDKKLSVEELAAKLNIGRATAYRLLDRAKQYLRQQLQYEAC